MLLIKFEVFFHFMHSPHAPSAVATDYFFLFPKHSDSFICHDFAYVFFFFSNGDTLKMSSDCSKIKKQMTCHFLCKAFSNDFREMDILFHKVSTLATAHICSFLYQTYFNKIVPVNLSFLSLRTVSPTVPLLWG